MQLGMKAISGLVRDVAYPEQRSYHSVKSFVDFCYTLPSVVRRLVCGIFDKLFATTFCEVVDELQGSAHNQYKQFPIHSSPVGGTL